MATNGKSGGQTQTNRQTWLIIFAALVGSVAMYGLLCFFVTQGRIAHPQSAPKPPVNVLRWMFTAMAVIALLASVAWMYMKTNGKIGDGSTFGVSKVQVMTPGEFQTQSIVALALAEACTIYGLALFFMGASMRDFVPFAAGTLLVDLFFILPRGLKYWSSWEQKQKSEAQGASSSFSRTL